MENFDVNLFGEGKYHNIVQYQKELTTEELLEITTKQGGIGSPHHEPVARLVYTLINNRLQEKLIKENKEAQEKLIKENKEAQEKILKENKDLVRWTRYMAIGTLILASPIIINAIINIIEFLQKINN